MWWLKVKSHLDKGTTGWKCEGLRSTCKVKNKPYNIKTLEDYKKVAYKPPE